MWKLQKVQDNESLSLRRKTKTLGHLQNGEIWCAPAVPTALRYLLLWFSFRLWSFSLLLQTLIPCTVQYEKSLVVAISNIFLLYFCVADVDECASDSHQCNPTQICINTEGGYTCSCTEGYWLLEGQCLGKILNCYTEYVYLGLPELMSLSTFAKDTVKPSAMWKLSFVSASANEVFGRETPSRNKTVAVNAIWLAS